ncbi:MAG: glycoside hydrolase family 19 protein [Pseudomonadota bacterium]
MKNAKRAQQRLKDRGYSLAIDGDFGPISMATLMSFVGQKSSVSSLRKDLGKAAHTEFPKVDITSPLRIAHVLAQQSVETGGFSKMTESMNYSVRGLLLVFSRSRISEADANRLGRKPGEGALSVERQSAIANILYGGDWGRRNLGNTEPGDGWRYRGRGIKQTTGRHNYGEVKKVTGIDVITDPELLSNPATGVRAGCIYWDSRKCNTIADKDDIVALTKKINGGTNGLDDRRKALARAKEIVL